jgi:hypothetical protein
MPAQSVALAVPTVTVFPPRPSGESACAASHTGIGPASPGLPGGVAGRRRGGPSPGTQARGRLPGRLARAGPGTLGSGPGRRAGSESRPQGRPRAAAAARAAPPLALTRRLRSSHRA